MISQCTTWAALHAELVELIDHANDLDTFGICESSAAGWTCAARWTHKAKDLSKFDDRLKLAANRYPLAMDGSPGWNTFGITDVRKRMRGEAPQFTTATAAVAIAFVIEAVVVLWKFDLHLAGHVLGATTRTREPSPFEAAILTELLGADRSLSSDDLEKLVERKCGISKPPKAIIAAIGKIRADCGMSDLKAKHRVGFKLTPEQVAMRISRRRSSTTTRSACLMLGRRWRHCPPLEYVNPSCALPAPMIGAVAVAVAVAPRNGTKRQYRARRSLTERRSRHPHKLRRREKMHEGL